MGRPSASQLKALLGVGPEDEENVRRLGPLVLPHQRAITEHFYALIQSHPEIAHLVAGRIDQLQRTHATWLRELFAGIYDEAYVLRRWRIGEVHISIGLKPFWIEGVMSVVRASISQTVVAVIPEGEVAAPLITSLVKLLDFDLLIINLAYEEARREREAKLQRVLVEHFAGDPAPSPKGD